MKKRPAKQARPKARSRIHLMLVGLFVVSAFGSQSCYQPSDADMELLNTRRVEVYFNAPGTRKGSEVNRKPSEFIAERIDAATDTLDVAVYGFNKKDIYEAIVRAKLRGVDVRVVGDAGEYGRLSAGFAAMERARIPVQPGNQFHIMHNKFFIIDGRFVFTGTGNISNSEFVRNYNNWVWFDSPPLAASFTAEFEQMFQGRFSAAKTPSNMPNDFQIGDTRVEVLFSPQEDTMGKILEELEKVDTSIHFTIFAFTKDQVASKFINKHREFERYNAANGAANLPVLERPKKVVGILDRSQLHGNGQYHQGYRLLANDVPMRMDANENSHLAGDYQAGGGRLHAKTMILDAGTPNARVVTGSFNWSSAATISNDEVLMILHGERIADAYLNEFKDNLWKQAKDLPQSMCNYMQNRDQLRCGYDIRPGDVIISEVHWDGWNGLRDPGDHGGEVRDEITNDQFIELYNTTNQPINLSMWTLSNGHDIIMGFTPGTVILPGQYFLVLDHNTIPLSERDPQRGEHAFKNPNFVLNMANDPRFRRLNLKSAYMDIGLKDTTGQIIDRAGNGGPPFFGGRHGDINYSMERKMPANGQIPDGTLRTSWQICGATEGGDNVNDAFKQRIIATPGQANSQ